MTDYGLSKTDREFTLNKIKYQRQYLNENFYDTGYEKIPYSLFFQNAWHNSQRYIAELNHRIYSLNQYADERNLKPIFAVLTLPSEYHRKKTIRLKNGKTKLVKNPKFIDDEFHTVKAGSQKLSGVVRSIFNSLHFRKIDISNRCYVTTREPHKDGTCHLNLLLFVPADCVDNCVNTIRERFIDTHSRVETVIDSPVGYIMKYIFKTLDDLRDNDDISKLSNITLWYIFHKIPRVTTSKTFVSLEIYRILKGQYDLKTLTYMCKTGRFQILLDNNNKVVQIFDDFAEIYQKIQVNRVSYKQRSKITIRSKSKFEQTNPNAKKPPYMMTDLELFEHYHRLDEDEVDLYYLGNCQNELAKRHFNCFTVTPLSCFNTDFNVEEFENEL
jgi:hypothetical protein